MAYDKNVWQCGDEITAEKLNHMEEGIENAGGDCDCGFECVESRETLTEESVTTTQPSGMPYPNGTLSYNQYIDVDTLVVTFDGTEYTCEKFTFPSDTSRYYGGVGQSGPEFSECPFCIISTPDNGNYIYSESAGTYSIKLETKVSSLHQVTECFEKAVKSIAASLKYVKDGENNAVLVNDVDNNTASGEFSYAEGHNTSATNFYAHAEGDQTAASGYISHAEGTSTVASGNYSHAEGDVSIASGDSSHAENSSTASGNYSHAEGGGTEASAEFSHAEGYHTTASGNRSHAQNSSTIAHGYCQTVIGELNVAQGTQSTRVNTDYAFIIGNGTSSARSNALAVKWDGTFVFANGTEIAPAQFASLLALLS